MRWQGWVGWSWLPGWKSSVLSGARYLRWWGGVGDSGRSFVEDIKHSSCRGYSCRSLFCSMRDGNETLNSIHATAFAAPLLSRMSPAASRRACRQWPARIIPHQRITSNLPPRILRCQWLAANGQQPTQWSANIDRTTASADEPSCTPSLAGLALLAVLALNLLRAALALVVIVFYRLQRWRSKSRECPARLLHLQSTQWPKKPMWSFREGYSVRGDLGHAGHTRRQRPTPR